MRAATMPSHPPPAERSKGLWVFTNSMSACTALWPGQSRSDWCNFFYFRIHGYIWPFLSLFFFFSNAPGCLKMSSSGLLLHCLSPLVQGDLSERILGECVRVQRFSSVYNLSVIQFILVQKRCLVFHKTSGAVFPRCTRQSI